MEQRRGSYLKDSAEEDALGGEERERPVLEGETKSGRRKERDSPRAGPIGTMLARLDDGLDEVQVLVLLVTR